MSTHVSPSARAHAEQDHRSIVVGVDHRGRSVSAVVWAVEEAERTGSSLRLVSATTHEPTGRPSPVQHDVAALARRLTVRQLEHRDVVGHPVDVLLEASAGGDLLVVGCRSVHTPQRLVLGSTSRAVACWAPVPVVVVPEAWMQPSMAAAPIVVGIRSTAAHDDPVHGSDEEVLTFALLHARRLRVPMVVVSAFEPPYLSTWSPTDLKSLQASQDAALHARLAPWRDSNPELEIAATAVMAPADRAIVDASRLGQLTVVGRHHAGTLTGLLGSTVRGVLNGVATPVAVVSAGTREALRRELALRRAADHPWSPAS